jgi:hypothetical protein
LLAGAASQQEYVLKLGENDQGLIRIKLHFSYLGMEIRL